jgi:FkbM family methyltransferase
MSIVTSRASIWLRNRLRDAGLAQSLNFLRLRSGGYEEAVHTALGRILRPGDIAWDVGANVGVYTVRMAERVGAAGQVFAFEPSPLNLERLQATCAGLPNVVVLPFGLSAAAGRARFIQGSDDQGTTSRLAVARDADLLGIEEVELRRGDALVGTGVAQAPSVVKIDVEGHEYEVLQGMSEFLRSGRLRAILTEVHFGLLAQSGRSSVPRQIEKWLNASGFTTRWVDASHLLAVRPSVG